MKKEFIFSLLKIIFVFYIIVFIYFGFIKKKMPPPFNWMNERAKNADKKQEYRGIVTDTYRIFNHNTPVFLVKTNREEEFEIDATDWRSSWEYVSIGDSIIKLKDELRIIIKKPDGSSQSFDYWE